MFIILSAQYVGESIDLELGKLPLSFLPLENRRLFQHQIEFLKEVDDAKNIVVTVPHDYSISKTDENFFSKNSVTLIRLAEVKSFGEELKLTLENVAPKENTLTIIFGNTLPKIMPKGTDFVGLCETDLEPPLPIQSFGTKTDLVWAGVFSFSSINLLMSKLEIEDEDIFRAIKDYSFEKELAFKHLNKCFILSDRNCYFKTRANFLSSRTFNSIQIVDNVLKKFSSDTKKIKAECDWFHSLPETMQKFTPKLYQDGFEGEKYYYSLEYLYALPLNELFVFGKKTVVFWHRVFHRISKFLEEAENQQGTRKIASAANFSALFVEKTKRRLEEYKTMSQFDIDACLTFNGHQLPSLNEIVNEISQDLVNEEQSPAIIHGDLCLSNIIFDSSSRNVKLIDPRGLDENGQQMIYGEKLYDIAKLAHSIFGLYDHIIAGQYTLSESQNKFEFQIHIDNGIEEIQNALKEHLSTLDIDCTKLEKTLPLLFISMIPLHSDSPSRQKAFIANSLRLFLIHYR